MEVVLEAGFEVGKEALNTLKTHAFPKSHENFSYFIPKADGHSTSKDIVQTKANAL